MHLYASGTPLKVRRVPPAALIGRVDPEDVQLLLAAVLLHVQAEEVLPVLVQVVNQVAVEAVLGDDVDGACGEIRGGGGLGVSLQANLISGWLNRD